MGLFKGRGIQKQQRERARERENGGNRGTLKAFRFKFHFSDFKFATQQFEEAGM